MAERLLLNGEVVADTWTRVGDDDALTDADVLVSWARLQAQRDALRSHAGRVGVVVPNTVDIRLLHHDVGWLALVVLELPVFRDGRAYSQARILRDQLGYAGELRATGEVLRDQIFYLRRVGFDAFEVAPRHDPRRASAGLRDFSVSYQAAADDPNPIYRR